MRPEDEPPIQEPSDYPIAVSQHTMSRIMTTVTLSGRYGKSLERTIRAIGSLHTNPMAEDFPAGMRAVAKRSGHSLQTTCDHYWTLIDHLGILRRVPETGTLKTGPLRVYWGTTRHHSLGRRRPVRGITPRTPLPVTYPPIFPGLYRSSDWGRVNRDGDRTRNSKARTSSMYKKSSGSIVFPSIPVPVQVTRAVSETLSAWLDLPPLPSGDEPRLIDAVWDDHPLLLVRPEWGRLARQLLDWYPLLRRDTRIARTMASLPVPLLECRRRRVVTREGARTVTRTRLVWRRRPVTRDDLDQILAALPDQGDAAKKRMAAARARIGKPHVAKVRTLIPIFAKLAAGKAKRKRLQEQHRRYQERMEEEARRTREATLRRYAPLIKAAAEQANAQKPEEPITPRDLWEFRARHNVTDAEEKMENISYALSWRQKPFTQKGQSLEESDVDP